jgi:sugar lactone lactonase YvrE
MSEWTIIPREICDTLGEGTLWSTRENAVYWVDILAPAINCLSLSNGHISRWSMPEPLSWVVERKQGGFIAGFQSGFAELDLDPFAIRPILNPEPHLPGNRMNDGKADERGNIWCGTMDMAEESSTGALYRFGPDRLAVKLDDGYGVPNGPAFSPCNRWIYHADTAKRVIYRFRCAENGDIVDRKPFIVFTEADGHPDGMTVDAEGHLWVAHWGGSRVSRFTPKGVLDKAIMLPARQITNVVFAGAKLDRMFVTSASIGLSRTEFDGALFEVEPGVAGLPPNQFPG